MMKLYNEYQDMKYTVISGIMNAHICIVRKDVMREHTESIGLKRELRFMTKSWISHFHALV